MIVASTGICVNHKWTEWRVVRESTCTKDGERTRTCMNPNCGLVQTGIIDPLGHNFKYINNNDGKTHTVKCMRCGESFTEKHEFRDGYCICGAKAPASSSTNNPNLDDVPKTGDITPMITMAVAGTVAAMAAALFFVFKRKAAK